MTNFYSTNENTTDVWLTPPSLVQAMGEFDLDPCSPNNLPWKLAKKFYSLENGEDGLALPWEGRVWCNPPYSNWGLFLKKLKEHGNGLALIFARTETQNFFDHVWSGASGILFIKRRVRFVRADGSKGGGSTAPSVLIAYGDDNVRAIKNSGIEGKLIIL